MSKETTDFLAVLGVTVEEVGDMGGDCARWDSDARVVTICRHLSPRGRLLALEDLLSDPTF